MRPHVCSLVIFQLLNFIMAASGAGVALSLNKKKVCSAG